MKERAFLTSSVSLLVSPKLDIVQDQHRRARSLLTAQRTQMVEGSKEDTVVWDSVRSLEIAGGLLFPQQEEEVSGGGVSSCLPCCCSSHIKERLLPSNEAFTPSGGEPQNGFCVLRNEPWTQMSCPFATIKEGTLRCGFGVLPGPSSLCPTPTRGDRPLFTEDHPGERRLLKSEPTMASVTFKCSVGVMERLFEVVVHEHILKLPDSSSRSPGWSSVNKGRSPLVGARRTHFEVPLLTA
ncbi:uncharacterized protein LOC117739348 [Cyclopterus lumpus]|uniref:uncharacterized protein LOC117739348 n=1 Tax=Cyclopterus lumpus TaxID=8103 RepID=UPI00148701F7|nr:uncharacterized protein LOC117739348 [Cyclopterus lumpus]